MRPWGGALGSQSWNFAEKLNKLFITHLHSDHTAGYPDFLLTPAVLEREEPLKVFGPHGIRSLNRHIMQAYKKDIEVRLKGPEQGNPISYSVDVNEISVGQIYKDAKVKVIAFKVNHGSWQDSFGYRFETPDKVIVISGDCTYSTSIVDACKECDVLIHEVYSEKGFQTKPLKWKKYHSQFHISSSQLAEIASKAKPKLLVLTHQLLWGTTEENLVNEIKSKYDGAVICAKDQDTFK